MSPALAARTAENASRADFGLERYLPAEKEIVGWEADGGFQEFQGDDLFLYMDGGAAIYQEYGFVRLLVQSYRSLKGKSLTLEIFDLASPAAAYGIYTFKNSPQGTRIPIGQEGCLEEYYLNFWKGHYLVTLTGLENEKETLEGLKKIGTLVDAKIKESHPEPALLNLLPEEGLLKSSIKYFMGHLGLFNSYAFSTQDIFQLREGIRGDYASDYSVYIIKYESPNVCQKRVAAVRDALQKNTKYKDFLAIDSGAFRFEDTMGDRISVNVFHQYLMILSDKVSFERAPDTLRKIRESIQRQDPLP